MKKPISLSRWACNKKALYFVYSAVVILLMNSCGNGKLTESKAEDILQKNYPKNRTSTVQISDLSLSPGIPNEVKLLQAKGLATYRYIPPGTPGYGCYGQLTESGNKYLDRVISDGYVSMVIAKIGFDKITGILEVPQANAVEVDYTEKVIEITPVGEIYNDLKMDQTYPQKAVFVKYEDGWRLQP